MTTLESIGFQLESVRDELEILHFAIYGDKKAPPNGGGVYGEITRLRRELEASAKQRDEKLRQQKIIIVAGYLLSIAISVLIHLSMFSGS